MFFIVLKIMKGIGIWCFSHYVLPYQIVIIINDLENFSISLKLGSYNNTSTFEIIIYKFEN